MDRQVASSGGMGAMGAMSQPYAPKGRERVLPIGERAAGPWGSTDLNHRPHRPHRPYRHTQT